MTEQQAVDVVKDAAANYGDTRAMNALGLFYMNGMFMDKDTVMGVKWLESAGAGGYAEAYHNLGVSYKLARHGMAQDLTRAFGYYMAGADSGSVSCMYDAGYMLYKGLGCQQGVMYQVLDIQQVAAEDIDGVILTFITGEVFRKLMHLLFPTISQTTIADKGLDHFDPAAYAPAHTRVDYRPRHLDGI